MDDISNEPIEQPAVAPEASAASAEDDLASAERLKSGRDGILNELQKIIVGQEEVLDQVLMSLFVGGNSIITGVPGLAKTLIIQTVAEVVDLDFSRIQFTPDLMPADVTGTRHRPTGHRLPAVR